MMNICFLIGKIISEIEFDFIIKNKKIEKEISIVRFELELLDKNKIYVIGYNNISDYCYRKLVKGDVIGIKGTLNTFGKVELEEIHFF